GTADAAEQPGSRPQGGHSAAAPRRSGAYRPHGAPHHRHHRDAGEDGHQAHGRRAAGTQAARSRQSLSYNTAVGLPLAVLGRQLDTRRPGRAARDLAAALWAAYASRAPVDVMVLELGVRTAGDMSAHLEVVRPDVVVIAPLAPSFSEDAGALSTLRGE